MEKALLENFLQTECTSLNFVENLQTFLYSFLPAHVEWDVSAVLDYVAEFFGADLQQYEKQCETLGDFADFDINASSMKAMLFFRLTSAIFSVDEKTALKLHDAVSSLLAICLHPACTIGKGAVLFDAANCKVDKNVAIGENFTCFGNTIITDSVKQNKKVGQKLVVGDACTFYSCTVLGAINIGDDVVINRNCVVLDSVESGKIVSIINQLQITKNEKRSKMPSQTLIVYGIVPKFKNTFVIIGEGFYNPTVLIKIKDIKDVEHSITYWDKNKIIVKIKNTTPFNSFAVKQNKIVLLVHNNKLIVINSFALTKVLTSLSK